MRNLKEEAYFETREAARCAMVLGAVANKVVEDVFEVIHSKVCCVAELSAQRRFFHRVRREVKRKTAAALGDILFPVNIVVRQQARIRLTGISDESTTRPRLELWPEEESRFRSLREIL